MRQLLARPAALPPEQCQKLHILLPAFDRLEAQRGQGPCRLGRDDETGRRWDLEILAAADGLPWNDAVGSGQVGSDGPAGEVPQRSVGRGSFAIVPERHSEPSLE